MITAKEIRSNHAAAEIPATLLALKAKVNWSRPSCIERGYVQTAADELLRLQTSLGELIKAKSVVDKIATSVGWPVGGVR
jgi:hypothetical protein